MVKQAVMRKTLTGGWEKFEFPYVGRFYMVKNFSDSDILVSFEENDIRENECIKIKAGSSERVSISFDDIDREIYHVKNIYVKGTGEVEIQSLSIAQQVLPRLALKVEPIVGDSDLFGKHASDLQEDVVVGENSIDGRLFYVEDYTGFSSNPDEQHGNYIALKVTANHQATIKFKGKQTTTLDESGEIVILVENNEKTLKFTAETELESTEVTFSLADMVLDPAPESEENEENEENEGE